MVYDCSSQLCSNVGIYIFVSFQRSSTFSIFPLLETSSVWKITTNYFVADTQWVPMYFPQFRIHANIEDKKFRRRSLIGFFVLVDPVINNLVYYELSRRRFVLLLLQYVFGCLHAHIPLSTLVLATVIGRLCVIRFR